MAFRRADYDPNLKGPLNGVRVIDLSRLVAGNMLSLQLADHGAEVVKIEDPKTGDPLRAWRDGGVSAHWKVYARNKKSAAVDLKTPKGREIVRRFAAGADVMIESFRPGRLEEMGLAPSTLHGHNPNLIVVRISGFGQTGPYAGKPGFGSLVEALSGFAARNGFGDREPALPPLALADMIAGIYGAYAVMVALRNREIKGGRGQVIDLSLLEPMFSVLGPEAMAYRITGLVKQRVGSGSETTAPRNVYRTRDDKFVAMSGSIQAMAERVFETIGRADMNQDPRFRTNSDRVRNRAEVDAIVGGWIAARDREEVLRIFDDAGVTCGPVYDIADIAADAHFREREIVVDMPDDEASHIAMNNVVPRLSETPAGIRTPAPAIGADTRTLLRGIGYDDATLDGLVDAGIIGVATPSDG